MKSIIVLLLTLNSAYAAQTAKVMFVRGDVSALLPNTKEAVIVNKDDLFPEDTSILTQSRSIVKIKFADGSIVNLGPKSKITVTKLPKREANIINVLTGVIKSSVNKKSNKLTKTKLVVKTQSAVMGVRGTKFQTSYSPKTNKTTLLTVEGEVAMAKVEKFSAKPESIKSIEKTLDTKSKTVMVTPGKVSVTDSKINKPTEPTNISPDQFNKVAKSLDSSATAQVVMNDKRDDKNSDSKVDLNNNLIKYKAGGYVDFNTGEYIEPVKTASLDKKTNTYTAPEDFKVDESGNVQENKESFFKKLLPKTFRAGIFFAPYSERINVDNSNQNNESSFNSKIANNSGLALDFVWNDKVETTLRMGGGDFEIEDEDLPLETYGDNGNFILDLRLLYTFSNKWKGIVGLAERAFRFPYENQDVGNPRVTVEERDMQALVLGFNRKLSYFSNHNLSWDLLANFYGDKSLCVGKQTFTAGESCEENVESIGLTTNLNAEYMFFNSYLFRPSVWFDYTKHSADTRDFTRSKLGLTLLIQKEF